MLWWFLILGISMVVVASVAFSIFVRVRKQMKSAKHESHGAGEPLPPPEP